MVYRDYKNKQICLTHMYINVNKRKKKWKTFLIKLASAMEAGSYMTGLKGRVESKDFAYTLQTVFLICLKIPSLYLMS